MNDLSSQRKIYIIKHILLESKEKNESRIQFVGIKDLCLQKSDIDSDKKKQKNKFLVQLTALKEKAEKPGLRRAGTSCGSGDAF